MLPTLTSVQKRLKMISSYLFYVAWLRSIIKGHQSPNEYRTVCAAVDHLAADRYRDYKLKVHNHFKEHRPSRPYSKLSAEDWHMCIYFFTSPTFVEWSSKNKANRDKNTRACKGRRASLPCVTISGAPRPSSGRALLRNFELFTPFGMTIG
ncbi:hypothetical protein Adt_31293 [Abeliophyllum distichum]|uniref:Uncharacterized protein n=1 Tax=Abeliophyllum distichum TaxID=126358 RepID=A0ABD1RDP2_9LAMI